MHAEHTHRQTCSWSPSIRRSDYISHRLPLALYSSALPLFVLLERRHCSGATAAVVSVSSTRFALPLVSSFIHSLAATRRRHTHSPRLRLGAVRIMLTLTFAVRVPALVKSTQFEGSGFEKTCKVRGTKNFCFFVFTGHFDEFG